MQEKKTILYVDDYADNRRLLKRFLEAEGYAVVQACDGGEALAKLEAESPDLALIDLNLPDINGYALSARIRTLPGYLEMPIIAVTAGDRDNGSQATPHTNYDGYLQKPFELDLLLSEIQHRLEANPGEPL